MRVTLPRKEAIGEHLAVIAACSHCRKPLVVPTSYKYKGGEIVPFLAQKTLDWAIEDQA